MSQKRELHPSVEEFREFLKRHPKLVDEVREKKRTWKELYEDWMILGEDNERFKQYKQNTKESVSKTDKNREMFSSMLGAIKKINFNEMQKHISQVNQTIGQLQQLLQQFQGEKKETPPITSQQNPNFPHLPFQFRRD